MNSYMEEAKKIADENLKTNDGGPFGACVVLNGKIIGRGSNLVIKENDPTAHAEIIAIREACKNNNSYDLSNCEIYTTCFPCPMCLSAIVWANIKKVYYGNTKEDANNIGFRDEQIYKFISNISNNNYDNSMLEFRSIDRDETIKSFNDFLNKPDKTMY